MTKAIRITFKPESGPTIEITGTSLMAAVRGVFLALGYTEDPEVDYEYSREALLDEAGLHGATVTIEDPRE